MFIGNSVIVVEVKLDMKQKIEGVVEGCRKGRLHLNCGLSYLNIRLCIVSEHWVWDCSRGVE